MDYQSMVDYQQRVIREHKDLMEKIAKLGAFLGGKVFNTIPSSEQCKMQIQYKAMLLYAECLAWRIADFRKMS